MALDIVLTLNGQVPEYRPETSISFEGEDADYWYLWSAMIQKIKNETGELIDLYDDAEFSGENLIKIEKIVISELEDIRNKKEKSWEIHTGTQIKPIKKEIFKTLIKKELEEKLSRLLIIIRLAIKTNEKILCMGD